jgi:hypothetical protein
MKFALADTAADLVKKYRSEDQWWSWRWKKNMAVNQTDLWQALGTCPVAKVISITRSFYNLGFFHVHSSRSLLSFTWIHDMPYCTYFSFQQLRHCPWTFRKLINLFPKKEYISCHLTNAWFGHWVFGLVYIVVPCCVFVTNCAWLARWHRSICHFQGSESLYFFHFSLESLLMLTDGRKLVEAPSLRVWTEVYYQDDQIIPFKPGLNSEYRL